MGKGEIARTEQFLLFPQCFLPFWRTFCHFHKTQNCRLQTFSVRKNLKFVVWERVKVDQAKIWLSDIESVEPLSSPTLWERLMSRQVLIVLGFYFNLYLPFITGECRARLAGTYKQSDRALHLCLHIIHICERSPIHCRLTDWNLLLLSTAI